MKRLLILVALLLFPLMASAQNCQHVGAYPWTSGACLDPADFNNLAELSIGPTVPQNAYGQGAHKGKLWLDTSVAPAVLRQCTIASPGNCATSYVATEWINWTAVDFSGGIVDWPIGGGAVSTPAAATIDLGIFPQAVITITGNASISSFGASLQPGRAKIVRFTGTPTLVNSSNMILPGLANIIAQPGDAALILSVAVGINQLLYQPSRLATGVPLQQSVTSGGATTITIPAGDVLVNVNAAATVTLPAGGPITVTDDGGFAGAHPIKVAPPSGTINGGPFWMIVNPYGSSRFVYDGTNYRAEVLPQTVPTLAALQALPSTQYLTVTRRDTGVAYVPSGSACSLNSGNGDNGSQVKSIDNKCWLANPGIVAQAVPTNTALQGLISTQFPAVRRLGFAAAGDGGDAIYVPSSSACSLNSGNGDNGSQVKSVDNKCWTLVGGASGVSPKVWGAVGDGTTEDSAFVSACFVYSSMTGAACRIPAATFVIDNVALPSPLVIVSDTPNASKFLRTPSSGTSAGMLHCFNSVPAGCSHTWISGVTIDGNKGNETVASNAVNIGHYSDVHVWNTWVINSKGGGLGLDTSVDQAAGTVSDIINVAASGNVNDGIDVTPIAWRLAAQNVSATLNGGNGMAIYYTPGITPIADQLQYISVRGGEFSGNGATGFLAQGWIKSYVSGNPVFGPGPSPVSHIKVLGITAKDNFRYGVVVQANHSIVADSIGANNNVSGTYGGDFLGPCANCEWSNLTSEGPGLIGLDAGTSQSVHVRGGSYTGSQYGVNLGASSDSDIRGATVTNNSINQINVIAAEQSGDGFGIEGYTQRLVIAGNRLICGGSGIYGLQQYNGGLDIEVSDNYVSGCDANLALTVDAHSSIMRNNIVAFANLGSGYDASITGATTTLTIPPWADVVQLLGTNSFSNIKTVEQTAIGTGASSVQITAGGSGYINGTATATFTGCSVSPTGTVSVNRGGLITGYAFATPGSGCVSPTVAFGGGGSGAAGTVYTVPLLTSRKELTLIVGPSATLTIGGGGNVTLASALSGLQANGIIKLLRSGTTLFETGRSGISDLSYSYNTPLTGTTVTMADTSDAAIIDPAGTLAALTVQLPTCSAIYDGKPASFRSSKILTSLTVTATAGTVSTPPTTLAAGGGAAFFCRGANTTWYRTY